jgi:pSer/pThr/pTyr-binding forkhead associated (FHA) protein
MEVSTGLRVELGPSTVVGRRPSAALGGVPPDARMVTVPSPGHDVSRNHLEVRVDGGRVTARDLGSTNGTRLRRSGGTVQLVAGQAHPLREGDVALLGDGVELRFTGLP